MLTDGRANVARDGGHGRARATEDALAAADLFRLAGFAALLIDTSSQPGDASRTMAERMGATCVPLPHAGAAGLSQAVNMGQALDWQRDGPHWPHHELSSFVWASGLQWHVQRFAGPEGAPCLVLLHGTGASTHSWRDLAPLLAQRFEVVAMDLPGHAFTGMPPGGVGSPQLSLPGMARAVHGLLQTLSVNPAMLVGHSAGAAVAVRMCLDGLSTPRSVLGLNAALMPLGGLAGRLFSPVAKLMASAPLVPRLFAWHANEPAVLQRLLLSTGSTLDATGTARSGRAGHDGQLGSGVALARPAPPGRPTRSGGG